MRIEVRWKTVVIIIIGVIILFLCKLSNYWTVPHKVFRQWSGWEQLPADVTSCVGGTIGCESSDQEHPIELEAPNRKPVSGNETKTKAVTKYRGKQFHSLEKLIKRRKSDLNKDAIDSWRQTLGLDKFDVAKYEDSNISEEESLEVTSSQPEDVKSKNIDSFATKDSSQNSGYYAERSRTGRKRPTRKQAIFASTLIASVPEGSSKVQLHELPPHDPKSVADVTCNYPTVNVIFSYMVGGLLATATASLSALLVDSIYRYVKSCGSVQRDCKLLKDVEQRQIEVDSNCNLAALPLDLQEILVKKLDVRVRRKGHRFYGWQKVGAAYKVPTDDLRYLKLEYKRDTGSPTSKLLEILGITRGITISNFVSVLGGPDVNRPDVASVIKLM